MRFATCRLACLLAVGALALGSARGDIIHLKRGTVEGVIVERTKTRVVVQTKVGKVVLDPADVVRVEHKATPLSLYAEMAGKVAADDAAGHYALALWCTEHKLFREAREELRKTLAINPDHEGARERLGYVRKDGQWMTRAQAKRAEGYVLHEGQWVRPEERQAAERRQAAAAWSRRIRAAIRQGPSGTDRIAARVAALLGPEADAAAWHALRGVLADLVGEALDARRDRTDPIRLALVQVLGRQPSTETNELLQRVGVRDRDPTVRAAAIGVLAEQKSVDNTAYFVGLLRRFTSPAYRIRGNKRQRATARLVLRRAALALGQLGDARAIPALARALFVRFHIPEGSGEIPPMTIGFSTPRAVCGTVVTDSHGNQMVLPVQEKTNWGLDLSEDRPVEDGFFFNEAAYAALRKLTGQDFSTHKGAWLAWWYRNKHHLVD